MTARLSTSAAQRARASLHLSAFEELYVREQVAKFRDLPPYLKRALAAFLSCAADEAEETP